MADDIRLKITQEGASETKAALQGVQSATDGVRTASAGSASAQSAAGGAAEAAAKKHEDLSKSARGAGNATQEMTRKASAGAQVLEGLRAAAQGGTNTLFGLGKAMGGVAELVGLAGPWGKAITLIGAVGSALVLLRGQLDDSARTAEKSKKSWEEFSTALEARRVERFTEQLQAIKDAAAEATAEVERLARARDRIDNAEMSAQLDELAADESLTPEQRKVRELEIRGQFARQAEDRRMALIDEPVKIAREQFQNLRGNRITLEAGEQGIRQQLDRQDQERAAAEALLKQARNERGMYAPGSVQRSVAEAKVEQAQTVLGRMDTPEALAQRQILEQQLAATRKAAEAARKAEEDAAEGVRKAEEQAALEREVQGKENAAAARGREASMSAAQRSAARAEENRLMRTSAGALDQLRIDRVSEFGAAATGKAMSAAERGAFGARGGDVADAAQALNAAAKELGGEATAAEISSALQAVLTAIQAVGQANTQEAQQFRAELTRLRSELTNQKTRVEKRMAEARGNP